MKKLIKEKHLNLATKPNQMFQKKYLGNIFHLNYTLKPMKKQGRKI